MAIKSTVLISDFNEALSAGWRYVSPGGTTWSKLSTTGVDCSGLFVAAFRRHGGDIYHGSNTMARKYTNSLTKLSKAAQLEPGMVVYKWQTSGGEPAKYQSDGLGDFHHVGLCVSTDPLRIVHASSVAGKVTSDSTIKNWKYCGYLKGVTYETAVEAEDDTSTDMEDDTDEDDESDDIPHYEGSDPSIMYKAEVTTKSGPLNVRAGQGTSTAIIGKVPHGRTVDVLEVSGGWSRVQYKTITGWCSNDYLTMIEGTEGTDPADDDVADAVDDEGNPVLDPDSLEDEDGDIDEEAPEGGYVAMSDYLSLVERVEALEQRMEELS